MKTLELYVESPVHALVGILFDREIPPHVLETCPEQAKRGLAALGRLVNFEPYICGKDLSFADIFAFYSFNLNRRLAKLADWFDMMSQREITIQVLAEAKK